MTQEITLIGLTAESQRADSATAPRGTLGPKLKQPTVRLCNPNPQVELQPPQVPVIQVFALQLLGAGSPGLPTAPLSTALGVGEFKDGKG